MQALHDIILQLGTIRRNPQYHFSSSGVWYSAETYGKTEYQALIKTNPIHWTEELRLTLEKAKSRLKTNKNISSESGVDQSTIGRLLLKKTGWVEEHNFKNLCKLPEFAKLDSVSVPNIPGLHLSKEAIELGQIHDSLPDSYRKDIKDAVSEVLKKYHLKNFKRG